MPSYYLKVYCNSKKLTKSVNKAKMYENKYILTLDKNQLP